MVKRLFGTFRTYICRFQKSAADSERFRILVSRCNTDEWRNAVRKYRTEKDFFIGNWL